MRDKSVNLNLLSDIIEDVMRQLSVAHKHTLKVEEILMTKKKGKYTKKQCDIIAAEIQDVHFPINLASLVYAGIAKQLEKIKNTQFENGNSECIQDLRKLFLNFIQ